MRRRLQKRTATEVDITPLLDVMFLLLIFFMVASSFHEETRALEITLPRAETPKVITIDEQVLHITVTRDARFFLGETEVEPDKLRVELDSRIRESGFRHAIIRADADAPYRHMVAVIDALNAVEVEGISFAVLYTAL